MTYGFGPVRYPYYADGWHGGYRYGWSDWGHRRGYDYVYRHADVAPYHGVTRNRAAEGLFWGALAGGVIGNNSSAFRHDAWRGALAGAATGWVVGAIADANDRQSPQVTDVAGNPTVLGAAALAPVTSSAPSAPVPVAPAASAPVSAMSGANRLFGRE